MPDTISLTESEVIIRAMRFSRAPLLLEAAEKWKKVEIPYLGNRKLKIEISEANKKINAFIVCENPRLEVFGDTDELKK